MATKQESKPNDQTAVLQSDETKQTSVWKELRSSEGWENYRRLKRDDPHLN